MTPDPFSLLAVHGNGGGSARFDLVRPLLPAHVRFAAPDLPGFGARGDVDPDRLGMRDFAAALGEELAALPRPRVLLGHGIGGSFVLELLQRDAALCDGVILHAPVGAHLDRRWFPRLMRPRLARRAVQWGLGSPWTRPLVRRRLLGAAAVPRDVVDRFFADYARCRAFGRMFDLITADWFAGLRAVDVPAVLLWGARERVLAPEHAAEFAALLPGALRVVEAGWDHFPMLETPEEYAARVVELAGGLLAGRGARLPRVGAGAP